MSSTSIVKIDDNKFNLSFVTSDFNAISEKVEHGGLKWSLEINTSSKKSLNLKLSCYGNNNSKFIVNAKTLLKIVRYSKPTKYQKTADVTFTGSSNSWDLPDFIKTDRLSSGYLKNSELTVEVQVEITSIIGNKPEKTHDFSIKDENMCDVVLVVEDRELHVSKGILASNSSVFKAMFFSDFKEKNENVVKIEEVKYKEFEQFLRILYHCKVDVDESNVEELLMIGDRYDVPIVVEKCEEFLINTKHYSIVEKLHFAEIYRLSELHAVTVDSIISKQQMIEVYEKIQDLNLKTSNALLARSLALLDMNK